MKNSVCKTNSPVCSCYLSHAGISRRVHWASEFFSLSMQSQSSCVNTLAWEAQGLWSQRQRTLQWKIEEYLDITYFYLRHKEEVTSEFSWVQIFKSLYRNYSVSHEDTWGNQNWILCFRKKVSLACICPDLVGKAWINEATRTKSPFSLGVKESATLGPSEQIPQQRCSQEPGGIEASFLECDNLRVSAPSHKLPLPMQVG